MSSWHDAMFADPRQYSHLLHHPDQSAVRAPLLRRPARPARPRARAAPRPNRRASHAKAGDASRVTQVSAAAAVAAAAGLAPPAIPVLGAVVSDRGKKRRLTSEERLQRRCAHSRESSPPGGGEGGWEVWGSVRALAAAGCLVWPDVLGNARASAAASGIACTRERRGNGKRCDSGRRDRRPPPRNAFFLWGTPAHAAVRRRARHSNKCSCCRGGCRS